MEENHQSDARSDEQLIEVVHEFPSVWKTESRAYRSLRAWENSWKEVAKRVSGSTESPSQYHIFILYKIITL